MTKEQMIEILRGKTRYTGKRWQQAKDVQKDFDEIADYLQNAVTVIRCKDCVRYDPTNDESICGLCLWTNSVVKPNDFCSDAKPIVHGHWINDVNYCSVCKQKSHELSKYCPYCGAKMDEVW